VLLNILPGGDALGPKKGLFSKRSSLYYAPSQFVYTVNPEHTSVSIDVDKPPPPPSSDSTQQL
jgi:hypothetical protein